MRARTEGLRDFGACLSPTNAFQLLQGVETLGVRMERHMSNTLAVLEFLTANKAVDWVLHPALENHPDHQLAKRLLPRGAGSIVSFRHQGRPRRRQEIHRVAADDQPPRQCRRRQDAGDSSRQHHASADGRRAVEGRRASARSWCGCRSASKPSPTSSTISARRFAHRRGCEPCNYPSMVSDIFVATGGRPFDRLAARGRDAAWRRLRSFDLGAA